MARIEVKVLQRRRRPSVAVIQVYPAIITKGVYSQVDDNGPTGVSLSYSKEI